MLAAADDLDVLRLSALHLFSFIQDKKSIDAVHGRDRLPPWKLYERSAAARPPYHRAEWKWKTDEKGSRRTAAAFAAKRERVSLVEFLFREKSTLSSSSETDNVNGVARRRDGRTRWYPSCEMQQRNSSRLFPSLQRNDEPIQRVYTFASCYRFYEMKTGQVAQFMGLRAGKGCVKRK